MSDDLLAAMRACYPYATLETHMLIDGELYLRCRRCNVRPVPKHWSFVCWCEECLSDFLADPDPTAGG